MSRIGNKPIDLPKNVKVSFAGSLLTVEGPKGKLTQDYDPKIAFKAEGEHIVVSRSDEEKATKAKHGLYRNLLNNMVVGVTSGFSRVLIINGVGYRGEVKGKILLMNLGYSNQIEYMIPEGIAIAVENNIKITVTGISKEKVGQVASEIRGLRGPEPYKGKGIRYEDETIRRKVGKSGVKK
jgi:large subunit ribosomal protein L6